MRGIKPRNILLEILCFLKEIAKYVINYFVSIFDDIIVFLLCTAPTITGCYCYSVSTIFYVIDCVFTDFDAVAGYNFLAISSCYSDKFFTEHCCFDVPAVDIFVALCDINIVCHNNTSLKFERFEKAYPFLFSH